MPRSDRATKLAPGVEARIVAALRAGKRTRRPRATVGSHLEPFGAAPARARPRGPHEAVVRRGTPMIRGPNPIPTERIAAALLDASTVGDKVAARKHGKGSRDPRRPRIRRTADPPDGRVKGRVIDLGAVRDAERTIARVAEMNPGWLPTVDRALQRKLRREIVKQMDEAQDAQLVARIPQALMDRIDAYAEELRGAQPGPSWKRAGVVRLLLTQALDAAKKKRARRR